ncbi:MAG TPA: tRNA (adenosine(37)-N6)-threonylcarbamoyltransferase complex ATPase subunit type 1 TsaE [Treponemataceae bacterium]|nr:tRNA (adenosine(37)-N6)-threonylcarbamoyltransferase complex ATPase subunit type 1 TsaE [Treponemataceae bacterium]
MTLHTNTSEETIALGEKIGSFLQKGDIIALKGTLAAGKTTITKGIARSLGIEEDVTSPTFTLISEYEGKIPLYHFDVYRLDTIEDFINLGSEELLYGNGVSIIEWSEKIFSELPDYTISIHLETQSDNSRKITIENWKYGILEG